MSDPEAPRLFLNKLCECVQSASRGSCTAFSYCMYQLSYIIFKAIYFFTWYNTHKQMELY